jgi:hypothetical protein
MKHVKTFERFLNESASQTFKKGAWVTVIANDGPDIQIGMQGTIVGEIEKLGGEEHVEVELSHKGGRPTGEKYIVPIALSMLTTGLATAKNTPNNPKAVIGRSIKFGGLEIAERDLQNNIQWDEANAAVKELGSGWRMPTAEEMEMIFDNWSKAGINNLEYNYYYTSEVKGNKVVCCGLELQTKEFVKDMETYQGKFDWPSVRPVKG